MSDRGPARDAALEVSRTGICLFNPQGDIVFFNSAWSSMLGPQSQHGAGWREFVGRLTADLATLADAERSPVLEIRSADERRLAVSAAELADGGIVLSVDDVSDREREVLARDRLLAQMVGAHDVEARRIAAVLHDDAVQRLTALSLRLELHALEQHDEPVAELAREAGAITASLRQLLVDLHPALLESRGLYAAVEAAARALRGNGIEVSVGPFDTRLPGPTEELAYRLVQEAFANILAHANATHVRIAFVLTPRCFHGRVIDDGRGFDAGVRADTAKIGLQVAERRAELAGGRLTVDSRPGGGTTFAFELPLVHADQPAEGVPA